jgi:putative glutamine amidotransferase
LNKHLIGISTENASDPLAKRAFKKAYTLELQTKDYSDLVRLYGGVPVYISQGIPEDAETVVSRIDALLLSGGSDLNPALWGEESLEAGIGAVTRITADEILRSDWENSLLAAAFSRGIPVFGICRGLQQMNVFFGGSMWQDLEIQLGISGHQNTKHPYLRAHRVRLERQPEILLSELEEEFSVTSTHHQVIRKLGNGLKIFARDINDEQIVEGIYRDSTDGGFMLAVQWHPERMAKSESTKNIMQSFMAAIKSNNV